MGTPPLHVSLNETVGAPYATQGSYMAQAGQPLFDTQLVDDGEAAALG